MLYILLVRNWLIKDTIVLSPIQFVNSNASVHTQTFLFIESICLNMDLQTVQEILPFFMIPAISWHMQQRHDFKWSYFVCSFVNLFVSNFFWREFGPAHRGWGDGWSKIHDGRRLAFSTNRISSPSSLPPTSPASSPLPMRLSSMTLVPRPSSATLQKKVNHQPRIWYEIEFLKCYLLWRCNNSIEQCNTSP